MKKSRIVSAVVFLAFAACLLTACISPRADSGAYDRGVEALAEDNYEQAKAEFEKAVNDDGRLAEGLKGIGIAAYKEGDYENAISFFDEAVAAMENENEAFKTDLLLYKADSYEKGGRSEEAAAVYKELESTDKADIAYAMEGCIYLKLQSFDEAKEAFERSAESKKSIDNFLMIYEAYAEVNLEADGAVFLELAEDIEPVTAEEYAKKGIVCSLLEDYQSAYENLNTAISKGCESAYDILGKIYLEQGDISAAKALYTEMIKNSGNAAKAYNGLAICSIAEKNYDSALIYISYGYGCCDDQVKKDLMLTEIAAYEYKLDFNTALKKTKEYLKLYPEDETAKKEFRFLSRSI